MLKEYLKLKLEMESLKEKQDELKDKIVKIVQNMPGRNEDKVFIEADLKSWVTYKKNIKWDKEGIKLVKKLYPKCIKESVDNALLEKVCEEKYIEEIDTVRTVSWSEPTLFVKLIKDEKNAKK